MLSGLKIWPCREHGVGHIRGSDLVLLWLWCRLAAVALLLLPSEPPYATGEAKKKKKKKKRKKKKEKEIAKGN